MTQSYEEILDELTIAYMEATKATNSCRQVDEMTESIMKGSNSQLGDKMIQAISIALAEYKKCEKAIYQMHRAVDARRQSSYPYRR